MRTCVASETLSAKRSVSKPVRILVSALFFWAQAAHSVGEGEGIGAELTDLGGNRVSLSSIDPQSNLEITLFYKRGENTWQNWANVSSKFTTVESVRLAEPDSRRWTVKFINGLEVLAGDIGGTLSGAATISGLASVPFSIPCQKIKDLAVRNAAKTSMTWTSGGLCARMKLSSGGELDLADITTIDLHESAVYYGLFSGGRRDLFPLVVDDYEADIPMSFLRRIDFVDHANKPLIVDVVYRPPGADRDLELKGKTIGYGVDELRIEGRNWIGSWRLHINRSLGHGLVSMRDFASDLGRKEKPKEGKAIVKGVCTTWDGKEWKLSEFVSAAVAVKIGEGKVDLPLDKIQLISAAKTTSGKELEILLMNGEKIRGEGVISGAFKSSDEYGIILTIPSSSIKRLEIRKVE